MASSCEVLSILPPQDSPTLFCAGVDQAQYTSEFRYCQNLDHCGRDRAVGNKNILALNRRTKILVDTGEKKEYQS